VSNESDSMFGSQYIRITHNFQIDGFLERPLALGIKP
jgi:hypothetical protein